MHTLKAVLLTVFLLLSPIRTSYVIQLAPSRNLGAVQSSPIIHIEKVVDQSMDYDLNVTQNWLTYPELYNVINLQFGQHVGIKIRIAISLSEPCKMKIRLMVDGVESKVFRRQVVQTKYMVFVASQFLWMATGKHTLQVEYIKTGRDEYIINDRVNMAMFKLDYLQRDMMHQLSPVIRIQGDKKKQKVFVEPKYPFKVIGDDKWYLLPGLKANIYLSGRSQVTISYKTVLVFSENTFVVTRILINNVEEDQRFRVINGLFTLPSNWASQTVILQGGNYEIKVQYRTPGKPLMCEKGDWNINFLQVTY